MRAGVAGGGRIEFAAWYARPRRQANASQGAERRRALDPHRQNSAQQHRASAFSRRIHVESCIGIAGYGHAVDGSISPSGNANLAVATATVTDESHWQPLPWPCAWQIRIRDRAVVQHCAGANIRHTHAQTGIRKRSAS